MFDEIATKLEAWGVFPVAVLETAAQAERLGEALLEAGLPCVEVTFRTGAAGEAIARLSKTFSDLLVGAGTVLTVDQARQARDLGARFVVSPGFDSAVVDYCMHCGLAVFPGVVTPSEMLHVLSRGLRVAKFFPAEAAGGVGFLKAVAGPLRDLRFIPTGGISPANLSDYLALPNVLACAGTWIANRKDLAEGNTEKIMRQAAEALSLAASARQKRGGTTHA